MKLLILVLTLGSGFATQAAVSNQYASLAYSLSTGALGLGDAESDIDEDGFRRSHEEAFIKCGGGDCIVRAGVRNGCVSYAKDARGRIFGFGQGTSRQEADRSALFYCWRPWGNDCQVKFNFCTKEVTQ